MPSIRAATSGKAKSTAATPCSSRSSYATMEQWSPDGTSLVYSDWHHIYRISADGGAPEPLLPGG